MDDPRNKVTPEELNWAIETFRQMDRTSGVGRPSFRQKSRTRPTANSSSLMPLYLASTRSA
jgi:hypothetical protein